MRRLHLSDFIIAKSAQFLTMFERFLYFISAHFGYLAAFSLSFDGFVFDDTIYILLASPTFLSSLYFSYCLYVYEVLKIK